MKKEDKPLFLTQTRQIEKGERNHFVLPPNLIYEPIFIDIS